MIRKEKNVCLTERRGKEMRKEWLCKVVAGATIVVSVFGQIPGNPIYAARTAKKLSVSVKSISMQVGAKKVVKTNKKATFTVTSKKIVSLKNKKSRQCTVIGKQAGKCTLKVKAGKTVKKIKIVITKKKVKPTIAPTKTPLITATPTMEPTQTPVATTLAAIASATPGVTETPEITATPVVTATATVEPTATPTSAPTAIPTVVPTTTVMPTATATVEPTETPEITATPTVEPTETPVVSTTPEVSTTPAITEEPDTILPDGEEITSDAAKAVNQFGYQLWNLNQAKNAMISPYSIAEALMMLDNAADGETKEQILNVMKVTDVDAWNEQMKKLHEENANNNRKQLYIANSIWKNNTTYSFDSDTQKKYIEGLKEYYNAEDYSMDFANGNPKEQINKWVSDKTNGSIPSLLNQDVDNNTYSVLANAVWFDGKWLAKYFSTDLTRKQKFYGQEKTTDVDMMHADAFQYVRYLKKDGIRMIELDFEGSRYAMDILLSADEKKTTQECFNALTTEQKNALFDGIGKLKTCRAEVTMPRFKSEYNAEALKSQLQDMGITKVFEKENAKLPGIQGDNKENAYIDTVLHKTVIDVKEDGVKAAASTAIVALPGAAPIKPQYVEFCVNRPFIYVIRDKETNMIYFMGSIENLDATNATE